MGEEPWRVLHYGAPGQDLLHHAPLLTRARLEEALAFDLQGPVAMVTYHPLTLTRDAAGADIRQLLLAIKDSGIKAVFTAANVDHGGDAINRAVKRFVKSDPMKHKFFDNLGSVVYLSCLKHVDVVIGNSSSGIVEAPSFHVPTVNIGDRQQGRAQAASILNTACTRASIHRAIRRALSPDFRRGLKGLRNPYAGVRPGKISARMKDRLKTVRLDERLLKKTFFDLPMMKRAIL